MNAQVGMLEQSLRQRLEITRLNAEVTQETMNKEALARSLDEEQTARREVQDTLNEAAQMIVKLQEDCENLRVELAATKNLERQRKDKRDVAKKQRRDKHIQSLEEKTGTLGDAAHASEDHKDEEPQDKDARHLALHVSQAARDTCVRQQFKALEAYTQFYTSQVLATQQATFGEFGHGNTADVPAIVQEKTLEISKSRIKETSSLIRIITLCRFSILSMANIQIQLQGSEYCQILSSCNDPLGHSNKMSYSFLYLLQLISDGSFHRSPLRSYQLL
jgi:hypothetical protein